MGGGRSRRWLALCFCRWHLLEVDGGEEKGSKRRESRSPSCHLFIDSPIDYALARSGMEGYRKGLTGVPFRPLLYLLAYTSCSLSHHSSSLPSSFSSAPAALTWYLPLGPRSPIPSTQSRPVRTATVPSGFPTGQAPGRRKTSKGQGSGGGKRRRRRQVVRREHVTSRADRLMGKGFPGAEG